MQSLASQRIASSLRLFLALCGPAAAQQPLQLFLEFAHILEVAVDAGEADVGYSVKRFEMRHDQLADLAGGALAFRGVHQIALSRVDDGFKLAGRDGAFFAGAEKAAQNFLPIEALAAAVFFNDHVGDLVDALVGGEAAVAAFALAAAADGVGLFALARVDDAILPETAIGTFHV